MGSPVVGLLVKGYDTARYNQGMSTYLPPTFHGTPAEVEAFASACARRVADAAAAQNEQIEQFLARHLDLKDSHTLCRWETEYSNPEPGVQQFQSLVALIPNGLAKLGARMTREAAGDYPHATIVTRVSVE